MLQVASFGDYFADKRNLRGVTVKVDATPAERSSRAAPSTKKPVWEIKTDATNPATQLEVHRKRKGSTSDIECLTYRDPFSFVYKK